MARVVQPNILPEIQGFPIQDFPSNEEVLKEWHGTSVPTKTNIGETYAKDLSIDPFYQAGMIDLSNVKPIALDPEIINPIGPYAPNAWKLAEAKQNYGYMYPGSEELFVNPNYPRSDVAATITHEGIHSIMDPNIFSDKPRWDEWTTLPNEVGKDIYSALGPVMSDKQMKRPWSNNYFLGDDFTNHITRDQAADKAQDVRNELITRWFENEIWGKTAPSAEFSYPNYPGFANYATMMRPGQGPLGMEGLYRLLSKKLNPLLKKVALQAHKNIEKKYEKEQEAKYTAPRHHQDVSRDRGDHTAPTFRDIKDEGPGVTASSGMHGGKHYADGGLINFYRYGGFVG